MTEKEAKEILNRIATRNVFCTLEEEPLKAFEMAENALEEIQQYRAIGTVEDIQKVLSFLGDENKRSIIDDLKLLNEYKATGLTPELIEAMQGHNIAMINDLEEYQEIGTVEELKEIRAKAIDEFAHQLKETLNQEFPSNYESTRPYFSLENARLSVDEIAEQMKAGGIDG